MKKLFILSIGLLLSCSVLNAQEIDEFEDVEVLAISEDNEPTAQHSITTSNPLDYSRIWKQKRYFKLSYNFSQTQQAGRALEKAKFGFGLTSGQTWLFPKQPVAGMLKFGFDVNYFDIQVAKYHSPGSAFNIPDDFFNKDEENSFDNLGRWGLQLGILGVGPNVSIAPFSSMDNGARFLRASLYFHYQPTLGAYLVSEDGDVDAAYAYCNIFQLGGQITWKFIGLGIEANWGSGKFKNLIEKFGYDDDEEKPIRDELGLPAFNGKLKRKFANTRLFITFMF